MNSQELFELKRVIKEAILEAREERLRADNERLRALLGEWSDYFRSCEGDYTKLGELERKTLEGWKR